MGKKYIYLLKNIGLMTISNFTSKILSFLLVPLYTSVLSTEEYGIYDIYTTTAFLLIPLLSVCISNAALRFALDKTNSNKDIFYICFVYFVRASIIIITLTCVNLIFGIFDIFNRYSVFFILYYILCLASDIMTAFARGLEKIKEIAISGILSSLTVITLNIILLLIFPMGIQGYFIANIMSFAVSVVYLVFRLKVWQFMGRTSKVKKLEKKMVKYSSPLIFDQIAWWINNVSDRYVVTWLCGTAANGIYSVAYKIPSILSIFQTIFNQAWILSAVKEINEKNGDFYAMIYKMYNCVLVVICSLLISNDKIIAKILYANEFYNAWEYAPFLTISVVFGCLSGVFEGIFAAKKETKIMAYTTIIGASVNTILNVFFVRLIGPIGAAIATLIAYVLVWMVRIRGVKKLVALNIYLKRDVFSYFLLVIQAILLVSGKNLFRIYFIQWCLTISIIILYMQDFKNLVMTILKKHKD